MKTEDVFFSIVIPTYNRAPLLVEAIQSVLDQKQVPLELIVVDDGSTDNTQELVKRIADDRLKYIRTENRERGAARNTGLRRAVGKYVNYFDSDDIFKPCLSDVHDFILKNNFPDLLFGDIEGGALQARARFSDAIIHNNFLSCGAVFLNRKVAVENPFSENRQLSGVEDWELWLRIFAGYDFLRCPTVIFTQRQHDQRSLHKPRVDAVIEREMAFAGQIDINRPLLRRRFTQRDLNLLLADRWTMMALALTEAGQPGKAFEYWMRSLAFSPEVISRKRYWAVLKKILFPS